MTLIEGGPGQATVAMTLREDHLNFNGRCHGGAIFALADTAFGLASNSHGVVAAGIDAHITYPAAARLGDVLTATAREVARSTRIATYRAEVARADGKIVAVFTGTVFITGVAHQAPVTGST
jgi:acyl-CoA thioesterase